jgi:rod shape-determining protein MreC
VNRFRSNRRILILVASGAGVVLLGVLGQIGPLRWVFEHTVAPAAQGIGSVGGTTGEAIRNLGRVKDLARDNAKLERENADLRQRLAANAETRRDNDDLRKQLGLQVAGGPKQVAAEVVAYQPDSYRQFVTINKGSADGIAFGMGVLSHGVLVGTIADVRPHSARITLVTDPEFKLAAKDLDTGATGLIQGLVGSGLALEKIGQTDKVKPGDTVASSGLGGVVPAGLLIGEVESVDSRANVVFQAAQVATSLRISDLRFVSVVVGT